jgi:predicted nucleotide-binding protein
VLTSKIYFDYEEDNKMATKVTLDNLKARIEEAGIDGKWTYDDKYKHSFRSEEGGIINFWPTTGKVQYQGSKEAQIALKEAIEDSSTKEVTGSVKPVYRHIFIVHGHDRDARDQLQLALLHLDLKPYVLMNESGGGKTIIEALEGKIGRDFSTDFGIVLMTPDDFGYSKKDGQEEKKPRARQNVVLEAGMLLSSLTRERMAIIQKGSLERPSDLDGIIRIEYNDHIRETIPKLCQRLREAGFDIRPELIIAATQ